MKRRITVILFYGLVICAVLFAARYGSKAVTVLAEHKPIEREHCIIIDPGHGGEDGGATSCTGKLESAYNLEISLRLNDLFRLLGYDTYMVRTTDTSVYTNGGTIAQKKVSDLKERVRIVNETKGAILLSIHQNNFADSRYSGAQVFYAREEESAALARQLQATFVSELNPGSNRKAKKSEGVYLMEHISRPGILIECGFLSNAREESKLRTPDYQKKVCTVIATTLSQYLSNT